MARFTVKLGPAGLGFIWGAGPLILMDYWHLRSYGLTVGEYLFGVTRRIRTETEAREAE